MENSSTKAFGYIPLQNPKNDFRLLILDPATDSSSPICCQVLNSSLDTTCEYEALSYVWGELQSLEPIYLRHASSIDESPTQAEISKSFEFNVRLNLEAALRALRLPDKPRILWIDSICINQNNLKERSEQVPLMGRIYHQCTRDVVWLGVETDKIQRAMSLIQRLTPGIENEAKISELQEEEWNDIEAMIGANPVWSRVWIIQELCFAPKILLFCHGQSLEWDVIVKMLEDNDEFQDIWINQIGSKKHQKAYRGFGNITIFHTLRRDQSTLKIGFEKNILAIVLTFGGWQATKQVDRIYGLLNLAESAKGFPVDYEKELDEVSMDFAEHVITRTKSLSILSAALGDPFEYLNENTKEVPTRTLPSWVMDISKRIPSASGLIMCGQTPYNACGRMAEPFCNITPNKRFLVASGWLIDTVNILNTVSPVADHETERDRWIRDVHLWAPKDGMKSVYIPTNEEVLNAYWRTITTDRKQDKRITRADLEGPTWYERYEEIEKRTVPDEQTMLPGWRFGISKEGIFCMLPPAAQEGDMIVVLHGAKVPYLLRPIEQGVDEYRLVGEAYMHGFMDGEVFTTFAKGIREGFVKLPRAFEIL